MTRWRLVLLVALLAAAAVQAQPRGFVPVTTAMLERPSPNDWLMFSRTYDAQRYSPLDQIDTKNVHRLGLAWTRSIGTGNTETIPLVYDGVMYIVTPGARVQALDATDGDVIWEYVRDVPAGTATSARTKNLAIYADVIIYTAPDSVVIGLDARTGAVRWEAKTDTRAHTSGPLVVEGLAVSGGACVGRRENCSLAAADLPGRAADQPGLAVPGAASPRAPGLDRGRVGRLGAGPPGQVLPADALRAPAAGGGSQRVGADVHGHRPRDEAAGRGGAARPTPQLAISAPGSPSSECGSTPCGHRTDCADVQPFGVASAPGGAVNGAISIR